MTPSLGMAAQLSTSRAPPLTVVPLGRPLELSDTQGGSGTGVGSFGPFRPHTLMIVPADTHDISSDDLSVSAIALGALL